MAHIISGLLFAASVTGFAMYFRLKSKYRVLYKNISCLELMKETMNIENSLDEDTLASVNGVLKRHFKADVSTLINIEDGSVIKSSAGTTTGIGQILELNEAREAINGHTIQVITDWGHYAASGGTGSAVIVPIVGKGAVKSLWLLEYRRQGMDDINFTHLYIMAENLSMVLQNSELMERVMKMALYDNLTGVKNRNGMNHFMDKALGDIKGKEGALAFSVLDIDHFKRFNDTYGHKAGDFILRKVAQLIGSKLGQQDLIARWGGEEFVICLPTYTVNKAYDMLDSIRQDIGNEVFKYEGMELKVTCSFGLTGYRSGDTTDTLFKRADAALYQSKQNGRNRVTMG